MAGKPQSRPRRSATGPQLWRRSRLGRLKVVDEAVCISSAEASAEPGAEIAKLGEPHFPDTTIAARLREEKSGGGQDAPVPEFEEGEDARL